MPILLKMKFMTWRWDWQQNRLAVKSHACNTSFWANIGQKYEKYVEVYYPLAYDARVDEASMFETLVPIYKFIRRRFSVGLNIHHHRSKNLVCSREHFCIFHGQLLPSNTKARILSLFLIIENVGCLNYLSFWACYILFCLP